MSKHKSIFHQLNYKLESQLCLGESKHQAKIKARSEAREEGRSAWGIEPKGIFNTGTLKEYQAVCKHFFKLLQIA